MDEAVRKCLINVLVNTVLNMGGETISKHNRFIQRKRKMKKRYEVLLTANLKRKIPKNKNYMKVIKQVPDDVFLSHFRMSPQMFKELEQEISPYWKNKQKGRKRMDLRSALFITLWAIANKNTYREMSDRFDISIGLTHKTVLKTCKIIASLRKKYVCWPDGNEMENIIAKFNELRGASSFPNVAGCVDGTHIKIPSPAQDAISYFNRKSFHSLILQIVCDSELKFLDVFFGWPGSSHDAHVWSNSPLGISLENGSVKLPKDAHFLGDSAYPNTDYLLVPYKDNGFLTQQQKTYNYRHSSTRTCAEQAIGLLKTKFRCLENLNIRNVANAKFIVMACVVLHNFILGREDSSIELEVNELHNDEEENFESALRYHNQRGKLKRDSICASMTQ